MEKWDVCDMMKTKTTRVGLLVNVTVEASLSSASKFITKG